MCVAENRLISRQNRGTRCGGVFKAEDIRYDLHTMSRRSILALSLCALSLVLAFTNCGLPAPAQNEAESNLSPPAEIPPEIGSAPSDATDSDLQKIAGLYSSGGSLQVVFPDGEFWSYGGYGIIQMRHGKVLSAKDGTYQVNVLVGQGAGTTASGNYVVGTSLGSANYIASSKNPAAVAGAAGDWWGNLQDGDTPYLNFSNSGVISGFSANYRCRFSGRIEPHPSGLNLLKITITRANCLNNGQSEVFTGIARVAGSGGAIHFVALNASKTRILTWEGYPD